MKLATAILIILLLCSTSLSQSSPKTVVDFYLMLPDNIYGIEGTDPSGTLDENFFFHDYRETASKEEVRKYRRSFIKIEDIKNGYLFLQGPGEDGWNEIALFKRTDGTYIVAITEVGCGPGCSGALLFAGYDRGKWKNVTKQVFPYNLETEYFFKLPRTGTTIKLIDGGSGEFDPLEGKVLVEYRWNKKRFIKASPR